jgi:hypothetical protein
MSDIRDKSLFDLKKRVAFDNRYSWQHLYLAIIWNWVAVIGTFGSAALAAVGGFPSWLLAGLSGSAGIAVIVLQKFSFYRRSRFHRMMQVNVEKLVRAIEYENAHPAEISKQYSELMLRMEPLYPGHGLEGLSGERKE